MRTDKGQTQQKISTHSFVEKFNNHGLNNKRLLTDGGNKIKREFTKLHILAVLN